MPKKVLKAPMTTPELGAYYNAHELLAPLSPKRLVKNTRAKGKEMLALPNEEFDGDGCA